MSSDNEIVRIPPTDKWLGSCPECGKPIWASYLSHYNTLNTGTGSTNEPVYKCIECKENILEENIIPF